MAGGAFYRVLSSPCLGGVGGRGSDLRKFLEGMTPVLFRGGGRRDLKTEPEEG